MAVCNLYNINNQMQKEIKRENSPQETKKPFIFQKAEI